MPGSYRGSGRSGGTGREAVAGSDRGPGDTRSRRTGRRRAVPGCHRGSGSRPLPAPRRRGRREPLAAARPRGRAGPGRRQRSVALRCSVLCPPVSPRCSELCPPVFPRSPRLCPRVSPRSPALCPPRCRRPEPPPAPRGNSGGGLRAERRRNPGPGWKIPELSVLPVWLEHPGGAGAAQSFPRSRLGWKIPKLSRLTWGSYPGFHGHWTELSWSGWSILKLAMILEDPKTSQAFQEELSRFFGASQIF